MIIITIIPIRIDYTPYRMCMGRQVRDKNTSLDIIDSTRNRSCDHSATTAAPPPLASTVWVGSNTYYNGGRERTRKLRRALQHHYNIYHIRIYRYEIRLWRQVGTCKRRRVLNRNAELISYYIRRRVYIL